MMKVIAPLLCSVVLAACGNAVSSGDKPTDPSGNETVRAQSGPCSNDNDCVPATCCHPTECVARAQAPDCQEVACTMDCRPGTMDCGQGACRCESGKCSAVMTETPAAADPAR
jgi:hypothetical protein